MLAMVKEVPAVVGAVSAIVLILTFVHEWAFFFVIGVHYQAFMSVNDYFNSAVGWLPWAAVGTCLGALFATTDPNRHLDDDFYRAHRLRWYVDRAPIVLVGVLFVTVGAIQFLFGNWYARPGAMEFLFIFVWTKAVRSWVVREKRIAELELKKFAPPREHIVALLAVPVVLFMVFMGGLAEGADALTKREPTFFVRLKNQYVEREWFVLRNLSSGIIARQLDDERIQHVRWDDIAALQSAIPKINKNGFICRWTGISCNTGIYQ